MSLVLGILTALAAIVVVGALILAIKFLPRVLPVLWTRVFERMDMATALAAGVLVLLVLVVVVGAIFYAAGARWA